MFIWDCSWILIRVRESPGDSLFKAFCYLKVALPVINLNGTVNILGSTCSDLFYLRTMCFFETRTWSNSFFQEFIHCSSCSHLFHDTSVVSGMYTLKVRLLLKNINCSHPFLLWYSHFTAALVATQVYLKGTVFISNLLYPSIIRCPFIPQK